MRKIIKAFSTRKGFFTYSILSALSMLLTLGSSIVIIRKTTLEVYGTFALIMTFVALISSLGFQWSSSSILYFGAKEKAQKGNMNITFWARNIIMFSSLVIIVIIFFGFEKDINNYLGINNSRLLLLWLLAIMIEDYLVQYFLSNRKSTISSLISITSKIILLLLVLFLKIDLNSLIWINIVSHSITIFYIIGINKNDIGKFQFDKSIFKSILKFSLWQLLGFSGLYIINFGDNFVIKEFLDVESVGLYNSAYKLYISVVGFSSVLSSYFAPRVVKANTHKDILYLNSFYYKERPFILIIVLIMHVLLMLIAPIFIPFMYGSQYNESVLIFNILIIGSFFKYVSSFYMIYFNTNNLFMVQQILNIIRAILNIILSIILVRVLGIIGPAIATLLTLVITTIIISIIYEKKIKEICI